MPNIVYRLIVLHYKYLFPVLPKIPSLLEVFVNILMPVLILFLVHALFTKKRRTESRVNRRTGNILSALFVAVAFLFAMLLSCQFTYGLLVIGSPSMTGTIDTGDAIIYRAYRGEIIKEGDIIVFQRNSIQIVHRVIYIQSVNGELRYFTRGDANDSMDAGYVTSDKIVGIVKTKIKYVGLPSLALRTLF